MAKIQLYIATTIDGFIARENGSLDWLFEHANSNKLDYGYNDFLKEVDIILMGRRTYDELMGYGVNWPYEDKKTYILSRSTNYKIKTPNTFLIGKISKAFIESLKSESKKNIWIVGGGILISQFLNKSAINEMILSIIPIILGKGVKLFPDEPHETKFQLLSSQSFETGVVNLAYRAKQD